MPVRFSTPEAMSLNVQLSGFDTIDVNLSSNAVLPQSLPSTNIPLKSVRMRVLILFRDILSRSGFYRDVGSLLERDRELIRHSEVFGIRTSSEGKRWSQIDGSYTVKMVFMRASGLIGYSVDVVETKERWSTPRTEDRGWSAPFPSSALMETSFVLPASPSAKSAIVFTQISRLKTHGLC